MSGTGKRAIVSLAGGDHPDLTAHNTLGLATQAELDGHNHDATYAPVHAHPYAPTSHSHVDADIPSGIARDSEVTAAITTHEAAADPHSNYLTPAEGDAAYAAAGHGHSHASLTGVSADQHHAQAHQIAGADHTASGLTAGHVLRATGASTFAFGAIADGDLPASIARDSEVTSAISTHEAAADPHPGYQRESERGAANGYASLDASTKVPVAQLPTGTTSSTVAVGDHTHAGGGSNPWTLVLATADESKNNTSAVADDNTLVVTLLANTNYVLRLRALFITNSTADLKYRLVFTGTTTRVHRLVRRTATSDTAQTIERKTAFDAADVVLSTTGSNPWLEEDVLLQVGASGGQFKLQWSQVTSNAGPTTRLEGSYIEYATT